MKIVVKAVIGITSVIVVITGATSAFGMMSSWQESRKVCEEQLAKEGKLEDKEAMFKRCDNMILAADIKENRRLVNMCTTNGKTSSSEKSGTKNK
jgi:hypothetical protein